MDFWSRLIGGGAGASTFRKQSTSNRPQQRLARFKRIYGQLQQTWRASTSVAAEPPSAENTYIELQRLTSILREETGVAAPHVCLAYASSARIYNTTSEVALMYHHEGITREAVLIFSLLVDSEEEEVFSNAGFAKSIMTFLSKATVVGVEAEGDIVELLFAIATKIRLRPDTLPVWFVPKRNNGNRSNATRLVEAPYEDDFPLFYLLLHYVHHEGSVGDFARTGLLYLVESASHSEVLEGWVIESDLATLMASGLGACYSQLSRKLVVSFSKEDMPAVLVLSDFSQAQTAPEAEVSTSAEFRAHMNTFLSYLLFWQDVLEHCQSGEVKQTLLDHFRILFLQQLLYPSLLESSDIDDSSVAVITYLRRILESINHPELIRLILRYLFASPDQTTHEQAPSPRDRLVASRRKSLNQLTHFAEDENKPSPSLFNLGDLILTSLRSRSQSTVAATLKLVSVLSQKHHQHTIDYLLRTSPAVPSTGQRIIGAHNKEMELQFSLVANLYEDENVDASYENYLQDTRNLLECHPCSTQLLAVHVTGNATATPSATLESKSSLAQSYVHRLKLDDPLLTTILASLETFLTNTAETNLNLTEVIITLASCEYVLIEGWLVVDASNYIYDEDISASDTEEDIYQDSDLELDESIDKEWNQTLAIRKAQRQPFWSAEDTSPVVAILQSLIHQVSLYRKDVPNFDTYLRQRKETFQVEEKLTQALASIPPPVRSSQDSASFPTSSTLSPDSVPPGSISQRMFPEKVSAPVSGSSSPRGRQQTTHQMTPPVGRLGQLNLKGSTIPSETSARAFSSSPLRQDLLSSPPSRTHGSKPPDIDVLKRKIDIASKGPVAKILAEDQGSSETSSLFSNFTIPSNNEVAPVEVSVSHLLTNVVILQEFILELAAVIQVRASLFEEVRFI